VGALMIMLSCQLEWAIAVYKAAVAANPAWNTNEEGRHLLRQTVLRAQRTSLGYRAVKALFAARLREVLDNSANVSSAGHVSIPIETAKARLSELNAQLPDMPVVWCYDEVQVLLTFDNFFQGTFDASAFQDPVTRATSAAAAASTAAAMDSPAAGPSAVGEDGDGSSKPSFYALSEDVDACSAELRRDCSRGGFYGLLVAMRHMMHGFEWGNLLCGSSLRLNRELLLKHSPAQGMATSMDADVHLGAATIRAWFEEYLTPAAAAGLDDALIAQLVGRPLYASFFFDRLGRMLDPTLRKQEPKAVVAAALAQAVAKATADAKTRVESLWYASFPTATGKQPQTLMAWLYYMQRMGMGPITKITSPNSSSEVMDAMQRGVLHLRYDARCINLAEEPIIAAAILEVGDLIEQDSIADDRVACALARRVTTGAFVDYNNKGVTAGMSLRGRFFARSTRARGLACSVCSPRSWVNHWLWRH
jgi:hypothetical protein